MEELSVQALINYGAIGVFGAYFVVKDYTVSKKTNEVLNTLSKAVEILTIHVKGLK